jgi:tetratricopeptide (TPR) repeat protein
VEIAEAANHAFSIVVANFGSGTIHGEYGTYAQAIRFLERGLAAGHTSEIAVSFPLIAAPLGWVYARCGRHAEALRLLEDAVQRAAVMGFSANHALRLMWLAEGRLLAGDGGAAKRCVLSALELAERNEEHGHQAYGLKLLGDLAVKEEGPDAEQAAVSYRAGLALARTRGMQPLAEAIASCLP